MSNFDVSLFHPLPLLTVLSRRLPISASVSFDVVFLSHWWSSPQPGRYVLAGIITVAFHFHFSLLIRAIRPAHLRLPSAITFTTSLTKQIGKQRAVKSWVKATKLLGQQSINFTALLFASKSPSKNKFLSPFNFRYRSKIYFVLTLVPRP